MRPGNNSARAAARAVLAGADGVGLLGLWIAMAAIVVMSVYVIANVIARQLHVGTFNGAGEISGYLLLTIAFFGLGHAFRHGAFLRLTVVHRRVPARMAPHLEVVLYAVTAAYAVLFDVEMWKLAQESRDQGSTSLGLLQVPTWIPQMVVAIGAAMFALQVIAMLLARIVLPADEDVMLGEDDTPPEMPLGAELPPTDAEVLEREQASGSGVNDDDVMAPRR